jgi:hypothetical protein
MRKHQERTIEAAKAADFETLLPVTAASPRFASKYFAEIPIKTCIA